VRTLSKSEVSGFVQEGRKLSDKEGTAILDQFERNQPQMYQAIFGELSDGIAEENLDMANLFLDLCFDIILVYRMAFGNTPATSRDNSWFNKKVALLDAELKSLNNEDPMSSKFKQDLSNRFIERSIEAGIQLELLQHLDEQVRNYASFKAPRKKAIHVTNNLLFVVVRLMDDIYSSV
jgi:hypothetical protein